MSTNLETVVISGTWSIGSKSLVSPLTQPSTYECGVKFAALGKVKAVADCLEDQFTEKKL